MCEQAVVIDDIKAAIRWLVDNGETETLFATVKKVRATPTVLAVLFARLTAKSWADAMDFVDFSPICDLARTEGVDIDGVRVLPKPEAPE